MSGNYVRQAELAVRALQRLVEAFADVAAIRVSVEEVRQRQPGNAAFPPVDDPDVPSV